VRRVVAAVAVIALFGAVSAPAEAKTSKDTITAVQQKLGVPADGVAGPQTRRALKRFQRSHGLTADGVIGPQTLRALGLSAKAARKGASSDLEAIAQCESGGDPTAVSPDGRYRGKYQFSRATWRSLGGTGDPAAAPEAEQDRLAAKLMAQQGPSAWPSCSRR
jgi:peptidoglycan hydrolase-like protein with peptidoglycan-binding domain